MRSVHSVSAEMNEKKNAGPTITAVAEHSDDEDLRAETMKEMEEDLTQIKASKSKTVSAAISLNLSTSSVLL